MTPIKQSPHRTGILGRMAACLLAAVLLLVCLTGCSEWYKPYVMDPAEDLSAPSQAADQASEKTLNTDMLTAPTDTPAEGISENGYYYSKDDVALYIYTYGRLPSNYITKAEAEKLGWDGGSLDTVKKGFAIGGESFGNREGLLPQAKGRKYTTCDIDTKGKSSRGTKRIVFSDDGLIFYSEDHYESFTQLFPGGDGSPAATTAASKTSTAASKTTTTASKTTTTATTTTAATTAKTTAKPATTAKTTASAAIDENGYYYSKDDVALYIRTYGHLPSNYITKSEAEDLGWSGGSVEYYKKGAAIGGDYFSNYQGLLPKAKGRKYTECDIDTKGKSNRGAKRIVFSNDGLIFYTDDHYESFTQIYP